LLTPLGLASWFEESKTMAGKKLQGQVAIVTGASRGIGAASARALARAGAAVVLTARSAEEIERTATELRGEGLRAIAVPADISDLEQIEEVVESAVEQFGRVDILINNAAIIWPLERVTEADPEEWAYTIHTNLVGPFYVTRSVLPLMLEKNYGRIVNLTSAAAEIPVPAGSAYCTSKAGLNMLTRVLNAELEGTRVKVLSLDPGETDTDMQADIRSVDAEEVGFDTTYWHDLYSKGLLHPPELAADAILWLVGPWSARESTTFFDLRDGELLQRIRGDLA
jgi:NAD(P)-dependent dehydrogenase (short-subunit alcohol dehydrogenase family)